MRLRDKRVVLGVTGGIAAYKAVELLRLLTREGARVRVVMTSAATRFVTPLTFRVLSGHPVLTGLYAEDVADTGGDADESGVAHIDLVVGADLVVVAPATANTLAKAAWGLADDALSTVLLAAGTDVLWAPAMNHRMWEHPVTRDNVTRLRRIGHAFVEPVEGWMACGEHGPGRMAEPAVILEKVVEMIGAPQDLAGVKVLVTAGRTEEDLDPVRFLTNRSSGRMGVAVAEEALARGAEVVLLAGAMDVPPPEGAQVERIRTAQELAAAARRHFDECDVLVMTAAVADYRPAQASSSKIKRSARGMTLKLDANPDILAGLAASRREQQLLVGFALETDADEKRARAKLRGKGVDLLVLNNPLEPGAAIGGDTNVVTLLEAGRPARRLPVLPKREVAHRIVDWVVARRERAQTRRARGGRSATRAR